MSAHTPAEALSKLVAALNETSWSSWQTTAKFDPALAVAQAVLDRERMRDAAPKLLEALTDLCALAEKRPGSLYEYKAAVDSARAAIAEATGGGV